MSTRQVKTAPRGAPPAAPLASRVTWRRALPVLGAALVASAFWVVGGEIVRRSQAASLPSLPDVASLPAAVREQIIEADAAARAAPASAEVVGTLGMAYHSALDDDRALQAYARAEALARDDWRWTYYRALIVESRGQADRSTDLLSEVTRRNAAFGLAWFRLAEAHLKARRFDEARQAYERARDAPEQPATGRDGAPASRTSPLSSYAATGLARVLVEQGRAEGARHHLEAALRADPAFGPARRLMAQVAAVEPGAAPSAEPWASRARAYVPPADPLLDAVVDRSRHSDVLLKHAAIAARAGDTARREFLARRAWRFNPRDPDVLMEMAAMLQASGRPADALEFLKQHEAIAPDDHHGLVEQGRCLIDLNRWQDAEQVLRRALRVPDAAAEYNLGLALDRQGRWPEARVHYERALALDPYHARALNNLGVGFAQAGDTVRAGLFHERALAAAPDSAEVYSNYANALLAGGRTAEAVAALTQALALDPASADAHNNLGVALGQSGRLAEAIFQFREALRVDPGHANARRNLAQVTAAAR